MALNNNDIEYVIDLTEDERFMNRIENEVREEEIIRISERDIKECKWYDNEDKRIQKENIILLNDPTKQNYIDRQRQTRVKK